MGLATRLNEIQQTQQTSPHTHSDNVSLTSSQSQTYQAQPATVQQNHAQPKYLYPPSPPYAQQAPSAQPPPYAQQAPSAQPPPYAQQALYTQSSVPTQHQLQTTTQPSQSFSQQQHQDQTIPAQPQRNSFFSNIMKFPRPSAPLLGSGFHEHPGPFYASVKTRIDETIKEKNLQYFYHENSQKYMDLLNRVSHVDFQSISQRRGFTSVELALDFASLALYDICIHIDNSGSMLYDENWKPSTEKKDDVALIVERIIDIAKEFDDDGVSISVFRDGKRVDHIKTTEQGVKVLSQIKYGGGTPLGESLYSEVLKPNTYDKVPTKPLLVFVVTDGRPDNEELVKTTIRQCKAYVEARYSRNAVAFMFAQVGKDKGAEEYLHSLDTNIDIKDDVDTISNFEQEYEKYKRNQIEITPDLWILQMMLGAISKAYDTAND